MYVCVHIHIVIRYHTYIHRCIDVDTYHTLEVGGSLSNVVANLLHIDIVQGGVHFIQHEEGGLTIAGIHTYTLTYMHTQTSSKRMII